ncbi:MAG: hypothetical protein Kow00108_04840 [Calditrichia bacterium]
MKILIVDDEPDIRKLHRYLLISHQHDVIEAGNGEEAMQIFNEDFSTIDLVVLDLTMPVMDGMQAFEEMRAKKPELKVLLITGFDDLWDLNKIVNQEGVRFLKKPFHVDAFLDAINELLQD